jgi:predicted neutral ceramidase superfamily lipid hydrolase
MRKTKLLLVRWAVFSSVVFALFWFIYWLRVGEIPTVSRIRMAWNQYYTLPFPVSRLWDVFFVPIWSTIIIWLIVKIKYLKINSEVFVALFFFIPLGIFSGGMLSLEDPFFGFYFLTIMCIAGLIFGIVKGFIFGLFPIFAGIGIGLFYGLFFGLIFLLLYAVILSTVLIIKKIFLIRLVNWLLVK